MTLDRYHRNRLSHPTSELRCACLTIRTASPADVRSIFLSLPLVDLPIPASSAVAMAERIAAEYGVAALAQAAGESLEVWLSRITPEAEANASKMPGIDLAEEGARSKNDTGGVLIADEDAELRHLIVGHLVEWGFRTREAPTAQEAIEAIKNQLPDLLLLEIYLPDRSGWDVLRELRRNGIAVPTIVVSAGRVAPCRLEEFRPLAYLPKPYPLEALLRLVIDRERSRQPSLPGGEG
ncbi:MAG TPA: response regulator [Chloroflexota bacterium]|nr:response regulator [Chloroflexota bacterium]